MLTEFISRSPLQAVGIDAITPGAILIRHGKGRSNTEVVVIPKPEGRVFEDVGSHPVADEFFWISLEELEGGLDPAVNHGFYADNGIIAYDSGYWNPSNWVELVGQFDGFPQRVTYCHSPQRLWQWRIENPLTKKTVHLHLPSKLPRKLKKAFEKPEGKRTVREIQRLERLLRRGSAA